MVKFTVQDAKRIGTNIGIDWKKSLFPPRALATGMNVELEHGTINPLTNITNDDPIMTAKIALAHLLESPIYYHNLAVMELCGKTRKARLSCKKSQA